MATTMERDLSVVADWAMILKASRVQQIRAEVSKEDQERAEDAMDEAIDVLYKFFAQGTEPPNAEMFKLWMLNRKQLKTEIELILDGGWE